MGKRHRAHVRRRPPDLATPGDQTVSRRIVKVEIALSPESSLVEYARIDGRMFLPEVFSAHDEGLDYAPNRKYQPKDFLRFQYWYELRKSQEPAYDELVREDPKKFKHDRFKSFIERFRVWKGSK